MTFKVHKKEIIEFPTKAMNTLIKFINEIQFAVGYLNININNLLCKCCIGL